MTIPRSYGSLCVGTSMHEREPEMENGTLKTLMTCFVIETVTRSPFPDDQTTPM